MLLIIFEGNMKPVIVIIALLAPTAANAQGLVGKAARETAEFLMGKFGRQAASEGAERLAGRIATAAARHGDDVVTVIRKVGPQALKLVDEAGENAPQVIRLLSRYGDDAARVLSRPQNVKLAAQFGDDSVAAIIKHEGLAESLIGQFGKPAITALEKVGDRGGRRIAMLAENGDFRGYTPDVVAVIARYGEPALDFVWRNKGALTVGVTLTAFLANPKLFIDGTTQLAGTVGESVAKPTVEAAGKVAQEVATFARWALTIGVAAVAVGACMALRHRMLTRAALKLAGRFVR